MKKTQVLFSTVLASVLALACGKPKMSESRKSEKSGEENASVAKGEIVETQFSLPTISSDEIESRPALALEGSSVESNTDKPMKELPPTIDKKKHL